MYKYNSRVRYSEVNSEKVMTLPALTDYFQDCCTFQSEDLNVGMDFLGRHDGAWILSSWEIIIRRMPHVADEITVGTWPCDFKGFYGTRNFCIQNEKQETIAFANSLWVYMNRKTGRPERIPDAFLDAYKGQTEPQINFAWSDRKIKVAGEGREQKPIEVHRFFIDTNHHMNNGKYLMVAEEFLPEHFSPRHIRVEYKKAAVLGDVLIPVIYRQEDSRTVVLANEEKKPYAVVQFIKDVK